ncbi:glycerol-3-phosphate 1-O-acyltransferase PlsY [Helicobacter anseris]|nr:glycerol-3-phosphate 1-O-acyltransferase PlsY [Helicobacter anseris]
MIDTVMSVITNINVLFYLFAYLFGGIPFGLVLTKIFFQIDIRKVGSGSIGATNVYRAIKEIQPQKAKFFSIITILLDATKGLIVVLFAKIFGLEYSVQWMIALLAILGHCYSPYLGFNGGKGVATAIGSVFLLMPIEGILGLIIWGIIGKVLKISSLSSLFGVLSGILFTFIIPNIFDLPQSINITKQIHSHVPVILIGVLIIYTHIPNIKRLLKGEEKKVIE